MRRVKQRTLPPTKPDLDLFTTAGNQALRDGLNSTAPRQAPGGGAVRRPIDPMIKYESLKKSRLQIAQLYENLRGHLAVRSVTAVSQLCNA